MGYVRLKPRRIAAQGDKIEQSEFVRRVQIIKVEPKVDLWFCDETGFTGDPVPRQIICLKGDRPRVKYYGSHVRTSAVGAVRIADGKFVCLSVPFVDSGIFQSFILELEEEVDSGRRNIVILDNASWHKTKRLKWGILEPMYLPPYSPELNPIEELWLALKREFFSWFWTNKEDELDEQVVWALKYYIHRPSLVKSICSMSNFD